MCSQVKAAICRLVYVKGRCNIPSFQKSRKQAVNMWRDVRHEIGRERRIFSRFSQLWWLESPGSQRLSSCSSWHPQMKWWTDCCDQLFPGFKSPSCRLCNSAGHEGGLQQWKGLVCLPGKLQITIDSIGTIAKHRRTKTKEATERTDHTSHPSKDSDNLT